MNTLITILPFVYLGIILFYLWKKDPLKQYGIKQGWGIGIFLFKVLAGTILWYIYTHHYTERSTADALRFYDDAKVIHSALLEDPGAYLRMMFGFDTQNPRLDKYVVQMFNWDKEYNFFMYNDNQTMLRFNAFCMLLSFGNYHVHTLMMCLFSYVGGLYLYKTFYRLMPDKKHLLLLAVFCIPSVALFSSGVLKEGIIVAAIGFFVYGVLNISREYKKISTWLILIFGTALLLVMKIYIIACFLPALVYFISSKWISKKQPWIYFLAFNASVFVGLVILSKLFPERDIFYLLFKKNDDFTNVARQYESGSFIYPFQVLPDPVLFLKNTPLALFTVFVRPFIWESFGVLAKFSSIENMIMLLLIVIRFITHKKLELPERRIFYMMIIFIFYLYLLIGFTTPVIGAMIRYKVPALSLVAIACLMYIDPKKLKKITPFKQL